MSPIAGKPRTAHWGGQLGTDWSEGHSQYLLAKDSTLALFLTRCRGAAVFPTSVWGSVVTCRMKGGGQVWTLRPVGSSFQSQGRSQPSGYGPYGHSGRAPPARLPRTQGTSLALLTARTQGHVPGQPVLRELRRPWPCVPSPGRPAPSSSHPSHWYTTLVPAHPPGLDSSPSPSQSRPAGPPQTVLPRSTKGLAPTQASAGPLGQLPSCVCPMVPAVVVGALSP